MVIASGGAISFAGGKTIHTFETSGDFNNTTGSPLTNVEFLAIAGGGGGGNGTIGDLEGGDGCWFRWTCIQLTAVPAPITDTQQ